MKKKRIVVHCADTPLFRDIGAKEITQWHLARGWSGNGYATIIRISGAIEAGRDLDNDGDVLEETGAHASGYNRSSIGICLVGGKDGPLFSPAQLDSLRSIIGFIKHYQPDIEVIGHRDIPGVTKTCPNFDVKKWYEEDVIS